MPTTTVLTQTGESAHQTSRFNPLHLFKRDYERYEGVAPINIYALRLLFTLMFLFLSYDFWTHISNHKGAWGVTDAVAWCVWGAIWDDIMDRNIATSQNVGSHFA